MDRLANVATWARLHTFLTAYDARGIAPAATALQVTPPAVSAAIAALEKGLGVELFARLGRGIVPTDAGHRFAAQARSLIGMLDQAARSVASPETGRVRVGAVETAAEYVLPGLLARFLAEYPLAEVTLEVMPRDALFEAASHHELDLVIAGRPPRGSGLRSRATRPNRLLVVGAPGGVRDRWLLRGEGSGTREAALALVEGPTMTLGTAGAVLAAAREGLGVTLAHEDAVRADLASGALAVVPVAGTPLDRPWHLCVRPDPTPTARLFVPFFAE